MTAAILIIVILVYAFSSNTQKAYNVDVKTQNQKKRTLNAIHQNQHILLSKYPFYRNLNSQYQIRFNHRLQYFIDSRIFIGREIEVEDYMKVLIAAAAIKFSFGIRNFQLSSFNRILIFPTDYYSKLTGQDHKGEANSMGILAFSWEHYKEGIDNNIDNLNLGIHEFAHAYYMQQTHMEGENPFEYFSFLRLQKHLSNPQTIEELRQQNFLREYAFTNPMEMFAVLSEHFFENPLVLQQKSPVLYNHFKQLLKLDTAKILA